MLELTTGDTAPVLSGVCSNQDAANVVTPANLTGAAVVVHVKRADRSVLTKTATITDADDGAWTTTWGATDLNVRGSYKAEAQVTYSNGLVQTFGPVAFTVREQIA